MMVRIVLALLLLVGCGGGEARGLRTHNGTGAVVSGTLAVDFGLNRTSGISPLYVIADTADATNYTDSSTTSQEFHDVEYTWDFGDTGTSGTGTWDYGTSPGVSSRNTASGPIAAHVYECSSGTTCSYQFCVTADDRTSTASKCYTITVTDPDAATEFATTKTACLSTTADHTGCPAGATQVSSVTDASAIITQAAAGKRRILLHAGQTFPQVALMQLCVTATQASLGCTVGTAPDPGYIGRYGTGANPIIQATAAYPANTVMWQLGGAYSKNMKDWRFVDIQLDGSLIAAPKNMGGFYMQGGLDQVTMLRVTANSVTIPLSMSYSVLDNWNATGGANAKGHHIWDQWGVVDFHQTNAPYGSSGAGTTTYAYGLFIAFERFAVMGSTFDNGGTTTPGVSHLIRLQYGAKGRISDNDLSRPGPSEHALKMHSTNWTAAGATVFDYTEPVGVSGSGDAGAGVGDNRGGGYTRWIYVGNNKILSGVTPYPVSMGPHSDSVQNRIKDVVFERNWVKLDAAVGGARVINFEGTYGSIRNNLFDLSGATTTNRHGPYTGKRFAAAGVELPADNVTFYGNTIYGGTSSSGFTGIEIEAGSTNITAKNNLGYAPADGTAAMFRGQAADTSATNTGQVSTVTTDPLFNGALTSTSGWAIQAGSPYKNTGSTLPVKKDFFGTTRSTSIGAAQ